MIVKKRIVDSALAVNRFLKNIKVDTKADSKGYRVKNAAKLNKNLVKAICI